LALVLRDRFLPTFAVKKFANGFGRGVVFFSSNCKCRGRRSPFENLSRDCLLAYPPRTAGNVKGMAAFASTIEIDRLVSEAPSARWIVLWTKARQEKAVARFLNAQSMPHYLPLVQRKTVARGRKSTSSVPLFPGYVFLNGTLDHAYAAISTKRVCQLIEVQDQNRFVQEIGQIQKALEITGTLELYPFAVIGRRCRVARGPFMGLEGLISSRLGAARLVLEVGILGQGAALEIDIDLLEPLN
jgi:transcription termination/antitermination protein NusG